MQEAMGRSDALSVIWDSALCILEASQIQEVIPMNESVQPTTSTPAQQIIGALYLLALLAAVILILL